MGSRQWLRSCRRYGVPEIVLAPSEAIDYELEIGVIVGKEVVKGDRLLAKDADEHIFGLVLVNDWSGGYPQGSHVDTC